MTTTTDRAFELARQELALTADDDAVRDGVATLEELRAALEDTRTLLLEEYPELEGDVIGNVLWDAAGEVWPTISRDL